MSPIIACANDPAKDPNKTPGLLPSPNRLIDVLGFAYRFCTEGSVGVRVVGTPMVALCQKHFDRPLMPLPGQCMAQYSTTNKYFEYGATFMNTRVSNQQTDPDVYLLSKGARMEDCGGYNLDNALLAVSLLHARRYCWDFPTPSAPNLRNLCG